MFCCGVCASGWRTRFVCTPESGTGPGVAAPAPLSAATLLGGGQRWIDIHCHLFNILDLPALQFINRTRLTVPEVVRLPAIAIVAVLVGGVNGQAMTARAELAMLRGGLEMRMAPAAPAAMRDTGQAVRILAGRMPTPPAVAPEAAPMSHLFGEGASNAHARPLPPRDSADAIRRAANDLFPGRDPDAEPDEAELEGVALAVDALEGSGLSTFASWANGMGRPRNVLTGELLQQFPVGSEVLLTPAMVDYSRWLGIEGSLLSPDPIATLDDQVAVMAEIARRRGGDAAAGRRLGMASFVPFCPWRLLEDRVAGRETMLDRLERWAAAGHVVGVKLYPPMGFRPTGNAARRIDEFLPALLRLTEDRHPGRFLDEALDALYSTCTRLDLAVMTHCGDSNEAAPGFGKFAGPRGWAEVLQRHPGLRLNLGHFGGVFSFAARGAQARETARDWAQSIARMITPDNRVYADLGFGGQFLTADCAADEECRESGEFLQRLLATSPLLGERLMYGSDFVMVGMVPGGDNYAALAARSLERIFPGAAMENFRWRNAAGFLGLGAGDAPRRRLADFLEPIAPGLLAGFDPRGVAA
jgi:predicted TIM-barrel fold metal-dependent hydrolase